MKDPESNIPITCQACKKRFRVKAKAIGRQLECPYCKTVVLIQPPDEPADPLGFAKQSVTPNPPQPAVPQPPEEPQPVQQSPYVTPQINATQRSRSAYVGRRKYPALKFVRLGLQICAGLIAFGWVLSSIFGLLSIIGFAGAATDESGAAGVAMLTVMIVPWLMTTLGSVVAVTMLVGLSELLKLGMDIQDNTWVAAYDSR